MAQVSSDQGLSNSAVDPALNQSVLQQNYQMYVGSGGNPSNYTLGPGGVFSAGNGSAAAGVGGYGAYGLLGGGYGTSFAPYDVGDGQTKWDEFVQQMQLEQQKLQQAQAIENARLAQEKQLKEEELAENQKIADQNTVEAFNKNLSDMKGPADPYGYLFASRGLAAPQGYAPTQMPLPDAVKSAYKSQGVDLASAQQQLSGSSGPSFIQGYLGGMAPSLQQGPMGFQNTPQFSGTPPGSQPKPETSPSTPSSPSSPQPPQPQTQMAQGGTIPGYNPGHDTVPAMLSQGEGVLTPQAVQMLGGPSAIQRINDHAVQHFASGGVVQPFYQQPVTDLGNGLIQRGPETGTIRDPQNYTAGFDATSAGVPVRETAGASNSVGQIGFGMNSGFTITGPPVQGTNNFSPNDMNGSTMWYPVMLSNGKTGYVSGYDLNPNGFQMPYTGTAQSLNPSLPGNMQLAAPGVAMPTGPSAPQVPLGEFNSGQSQPSQGASTSTSGMPLLTGGVLNPSGPVNGPVMNLNNLDPYTRSMVDQYGRPQIPSAQALSNMPQSGLDAYKNYVEKVAGGNFQDLLDQSKQLNPSGFDPGSLNFQ